MKRFKFRLQVLLDQRKAKEDQLLAELGILQCEEADELEKLRMMCDGLQASLNEMSKAMGCNAASGELFRRDEYSKALMDDIKVQELTIKAVHSKVEAKRAEVVEAMKDRKVLETLRDKQEQEYILACERAEQNQIDEITSVRYAREM